jgi:hypothetical protein
MDNLNYNEILEYFTHNSIYLLVALLLLALLCAFIFSKRLKNTGLFFLVLVFVIDRLILLLPFDLYITFPVLKTIITFLYLVGFVIFAIKVALKLFKNTILKYEYKEGSKLTRFFKFTGSLPFFIMLLLNVVNIFYDIFPQFFLTGVTSLTFLLMTVKTIYSSFKYVDKKELSEELVMNFDDIKEHLDDETDRPIKANSNEGRRVIKTKNSKKKQKEKPKDLEKTQFIIKKKDPPKQGPVVDPTERIYVKDIKYTDEKRYNPKKKEVLDDDLLLIKKELSTTDLISLVTRDFSHPLNTTRISIIDLVYDNNLSYTSKACIAKIQESNEYKLDLEFKNYNEYDYGRFIDILIEYSKDKKRYKFELELIPHNNENSKVVFYDPSEIFDSNDLFSDSFQGKTISMNFPKYKINFITGN